MLFILFPPPNQIVTMRQGQYTTLPGQKPRLSIILQKLHPTY